MDKQEFPDDLAYTSEHEWVRQPGDADGSVRVGITDYAQQALGDIVFVSLPEVGAEVQAGSPCGELESTKSVSDLYAPITGTVVARNESLAEHPELINTAPYGDGWMIELRPADVGDLASLLDAEAYRSDVQKA
jgi:glycine cleavage system H protein